ncbi:MAG: hypothetical protein HGA87_03185 [Desulfobulbaceae bacterium]|nr:hypothetical protein [Desulfobulbaceae bacterium]
MKAFPVVDYNPHSLPPRTYWTFPVDIPRNSVGTFCEHLHLLIAEKSGASLFSPDTENERNTCRFEWNRKWMNEQFGLRIGLTFVVSKDPIAEIQGYVTTKDLINATEGTPPILDAALVTSITAEISETIWNALNWEIVEQEKKEWRVIFHVSVPHALGFSQSVETANGRFRFLKTRIVPKDLTRVSALIVKCEARSSVIAQQTASAEVMIVLALLTLAERSKYELAPQKWPRSRKFNNVLPSSKTVNEDKLYPLRCYVEGVEAMDQGVIQRFDELWAAYETLQDADRKVFTPALLAHYAALNSSINYATISTIAHIASLAALSKTLQKKCTGELTCSLHGHLNWKHDEMSETKAIIETILTTCTIQDEAQRTDIKKLIQRTHREQRSAFVHGAQLRHAEFSQGAQMPPAIPANDAATNELFKAQEDLISIAGITRRTLIEWLEMKSARRLDRPKMNISTERVVYHQRLATTVTLHANVVTQIAMQPPVAMVAKADHHSSATIVYG